VDIPETAYSPDVGYIQVGMYDPEGPRLTTSEGQGALRLADVQVQPRPGEVPNPVKVIFGGKVILAGYELDRRVVRPGETIHLTLYWRARKEMKKDYRVFAHVLGVGDQVWAQDDGHPKGGNPPTSEWVRRELIVEVRELTVGLTTPPGFYDIEVGWYDAHAQRLMVRGENDQWLDNRALLSKILVQDGQSD
jgi:hypothetical protein